MNPHQKLIVLATTIAVVLILHFSFCVWSFGSVYEVQSGWDSSLPSIAQQLFGFHVGINAATERFYGLAARWEPSKGVLFGIVLPLLLTGGCGVLMLRR